MKPQTNARDHSGKLHQDVPAGEASPLASTVLDYCRELQRRVQPKAAARDTSFFDLLDLADRTPVEPTRP
jgi:hypothetical protein